MKEIPILFSAPMVRALLAGTKTQTRRKIAFPRHTGAFVLVGKEDSRWPYVSSDGESTLDPNGNESPMACPYGQPGDRLWVRETWAAHVGWDSVKPCELQHDDRSNFWWAADPKGTAGSADIPEFRRGKWRPSIFMPRWASRITLEITEVRVQRLQDISEEDAQAEGVEALDFERYDHDFSICPQCGGTRLYTAFCGDGGAMFDTDCGKCDTHLKRYGHLWESISGPGSWDANPWVWCVSFQGITGGQHEG